MILERIALKRHFEINIPYLPMSIESEKLREVAKQLLKDAESLRRECDRLMTEAEKLDAAITKGQIKKKPA